MALKLNFLPCIDARFCLTANVLAGCTIHHPRHPPNPDVEKITPLDNGGGEFDFDDDDVAMMDEEGEAIMMRFVYELCS